MKNLQTIKKEFKEKWISTNSNGFSFLEIIVTVSVLAILTMGAFVITGQLQQSAQQTIVNNAVNEVYVAATSEKELSKKNEIKNPAFSAADSWVQTSDKESAKGVDLRGFMVDKNGNITEDSEGTIVIVGVSKGLGNNRDGYPYFYWRTTLDADKASMWNLIQKHNVYLEQDSSNNN